MHASLGPHFRREGAASVAGELTTITVALDRMTATQLRELTWGDPHRSATAEALAGACGTLLRQAIQALIMVLSRR